MLLNIISIQDADVTWSRLPYDATCSIRGLFRGFNVEYRKPDGDVIFGSTIWTNEDPDSEDFEFVCQRASMRRFEDAQPTGRVVFRGYARECYDIVEGELYLEDSSAEEVEDYLKRQAEPVTLGGLVWRDV